MTDKMTDEQLIDYCDLHSETERALFSRQHINRMLELAGEEPVGNLPDFVSSHEIMKSLVALARKRNV